jgi:hypothetical protein
MYLLDTNVFVTSKNSHYGFDFAPGFWDWIDRAHAAGAICSLDKVKDELDAVQDELTTWAAARVPLFLAMDQAAIASIQQLAAWVNASNYRPGAKAAFLSVADHQLIAFAHAHGHTVVTHELSEPQNRRKIKIPDACAQMNVPCINLFEVLRAEKARLVLAS